MRTLLGILKSIPVNSGKSETKDTKQIFKLISFWWCSCCLFFSFQFCVLCTIICLFFFFFDSYGVVSLFSIYEFDCPSGVFRTTFRRRTDKSIAQNYSTNYIVEAKLTTARHNMKNYRQSYPNWTIIKKRSKFVYQGNQK